MDLTETRNLTVTGFSKMVISQDSTRGGEDICEVTGMAKNGGLTK